MTGGEEMDVVCHDDPRVEFDQAVARVCGELLADDRADWIRHHPMLSLVARECDERAARVFMSVLFLHGPFLLWPI